MHWAQQTAQNGTWEINRHRHSIVRVGVIDTFFPRHDDLTFARVFGNNIPHNVSMVNYNHGIHVAGIIGADFNNGRGISGVAPNADLYVYGLHSAFLSTNVNRVHISLFGIMHSVATLFANDVNLINISMGVCNKARFQAMIAESYRANLYAFDIYAELNNALRVERDFLTVFLMRYYNLGQDFLIVQAAGNNSSREYRNHQNFIVKSLRGRVVNVGYSGLFVNIKNEEIKNRIVIVGNMRWIGNSHRTSQTGSRVDIFAPGADIISAHFNGDLVDGVVVPRILRRGRGRVVPIEPLYRPLNSTSMAAAHVAGVLAMMWGVNPYLTGAQLADLLLENTLRYIDLDYNDNVYIGAKRLISVRVDEDGWSVHNPSSPAAITHYHPILDAAAAVNAALTAAG
jgi:subtilisin family serine protease